MLKKSKTAFMNLQIRFKVILCMTVLVLLSIMTVGLSSSYIFAKQYMKQVETQTDVTFDTTSKMLENDIENLYRKVVNLTAKPIFQAIAYETSEDKNNSNFSEIYHSIDDLFTRFLANADLVDNMILLCKNGTMYSTYTIGLNYTIDQFQQEMRQTCISWLPVEKSKLFASVLPVIPVCFPLHCDRMNISFCNGQPADMVLVTYLNLENVQHKLEQMNNIGYSRIYLSDAQGTPITISAQDELYKEMVKSEFQKRILENTERISFDEKMDGKKYQITTQGICGSDLHIVSVFAYESMQNAVNDIWQVTIVIASVILIVIMAIALNLARTITIPIQHLMEQVKKVQHGDYKLKPVTKYEDEIHAMDLALCDMSSKISDQIQAILNTEELRRKAELAAMNEQINQHFLYNTLDCIYWEILNGHEKNAADMVESLGQFLRLSLNHGQELLDLQHTIYHTQQYINIMNFRLGARVKFTYTVAPQLQTLMVPKSILQPLAENSILHGFESSSGEIEVDNPAIDITGRVEGETAIIIVADNGCGFDVDIMQKSLKEPRKHVGLYNICQRLKYSFGENVTVRFSSIPYYRNEVVIKFPITHQNKPQASDTI